MTPHIPQIYCRQPKTVELIEAEPVFKALTGFQPPQNDDIRCSGYSPLGTLFIYAKHSGVVVCDASSGAELFTIDIKDVFEYDFAPKDSILTTWSRPTKLEDDSGNWADNVNVYLLDPTAKTYSTIQSYLNQAKSGWKPQFSADETMFARTVNPSQIDFFSVRQPSKKPAFSLNVKDTGKIQSFQMSPGRTPSVAVFIPGKNGNAAYIKVYSLPNVNTPTSQKQFFKGDTCQFQWNALGTSILALVSTDVDSSNKSYYGESQLYLFGITGAFDHKINLEKEGPIHDITWSPTSREFAVIYGYMPSNTTFFDARGNEIHSLPPAPRNTILYSPHAKYILTAGFGNLQGDVDILDRQARFNKVASFQASNTSVCKWAPDGRFILTATTSPRLRVDNCVKIWYFNGTLCYIKQFSELFGVDWRFQPLGDFPPISTAKVDKCDCAPDISAVEFLAKKLSLSGGKKSTGGGGAYRPPHARGTTRGTRTLADMEAEQKGTSEAFRPSSSRRTVPGSTLAQPKKKQPQRTPSPARDADQSGVIGGVFSLEEKKIRNLLKKLRSIEKLKVKQANGDFLEKTQVLKIDTESQVRSELKSLGWKQDE